MTSAIQQSFQQGLFAVTLFTHNLEASKAFYGSALGLTQIYTDDVSAVYRCGGTLINVLSDTQSAELLEPAKLGDPEGVRAVFTLRCADVDAAVAELVACGVAILNGPIDRPWGVRTASFQDPSGHTWELANHA
jgi:catechol 2,3-dioxygenase-like lactoylglutathione lyase family enzyme